jgi:hypothetical protein
MKLSITCIDAYTYEPTIRALERTIETLKDKIEISTVYWFSDIAYPKETQYNVKWVKIPRFKKYTDEYNYITLKLVPHVAVEDFNLVIHADGFAVNKDAWDPQFLEYDYLGARWNNGGVGNGGFTLRSRKLYDAMIDVDILYKTSQYPQEIIDNHEFYVLDYYGDKVIPEDNIICKIYRHKLEQEYGIKFGDGDIVDKFSIEYNMSSHWLGKSLGFHGKHGIAEHYGVTL